MQFGFLVLAAIGFVLAARHVQAGWFLAAAGVVIGSLRAAFAGKWASLINPIHVLAAGFWIGTLFVLVVAGLAALLKHESARARRGAIAADMVNGFSPLALSMGGIVVLFGVITAWRHLHKLDAALDNAVRLRTHRQAHLRCDGVWARRMELASATTHPRNGRGRVVDPPIRVRGAARCRDRADDHGDPGQPSVAQSMTKRHVRHRPKCATMAFRAASSADCGVVP